MRGNTRAVPLALAYMRTLERPGVRVLNGADVFALELSKSAQATLLRTLGIDTPRSITFNDVAALRAHAGRSLARAAQAGSRRKRRAHPGRRVARPRSKRSSAATRVWLPDNLFLLQEYLPHDPEQGIVRLEFLGGELLYAMRVKTHGRFNLCPSPVCNPDDGDGVVRAAGRRAVARRRWSSSRIRRCRGRPSTPRGGSCRRRGWTSAASRTSRHHDGRRVFYDINANSNLRPSVAAAFGFDPFERVVDFLVRELSRSRQTKFSHLVI